MGLGRLGRVLALALHVRLDSLHRPVGVQRRILSQLAHAGTERGGTALLASRWERDPERPKRPKNPWMRFLDDARRERPGLQAAILMRWAARQWRAMTKAPDTSACLRNPQE